MSITIVKLWDFFTSRTKRVTDATLVGDDLMLLQYQLRDDAADAQEKPMSFWLLSQHHTPESSCSTKCNTWKVLKNVLYCDTDINMYVHDKERCELPNIPIGSSLGEMTDELPNDVLIDKFWNAGPKFYCLSGHNVNSGLENNVFKVKRVALSRATEKNVQPRNFQKTSFGCNSWTAQPLHEFVS